MIDFDYVTSKPLSEQEQKEIENLLKMKTAKNKYEILVYPKSKNDFLKESDNGFEVKDLSNLANDLELRKQELEREEKGENNENL